MEVLAAIRLFQGRRRPEERLHWNRILLDVRPPLLFSRDEILAMTRKLVPATEGLGIESVSLRAELPDPRTGELRPSLLLISSPGRSGLSIREVPPESEPIRPLSEYGQKVTRLRQRGLTYPYEIVRLMTPAAGARSDFPPGTFEEMDLDDAGRLVGVERAYGKNTANVVVGVVRNVTPRYPEGMRRVILLGDPSHEMGSVAEPECRRILAALDLAERLEAPLEWFTLSAGAKISMQSGTENMDWISRVLRRLVQFTQAGGEVNLVICGINVGRPALLERRGHDAHAHPGHPGHGARGGHGPDRQDRPRLLGLRLRRGQPRHRRLRPDHGPERRGPVLGPRHR